MPRYMGAMAAALIMTGLLGTPRADQGGSSPAFGSAEPPYRLEYQDGLVTVSGSKIPVLAALEEIAAHANVKIVVYGPCRKHISIHCPSRPLGQAISRMLRGCSHAVIYYDGQADNGQGVSTVSGSASEAAGPERSQSKAAGPAALPLETPEPLDPEKMLHHEIERLQARIARGESDRQKALWAGHRAPRFLPDDRARLEELKARLHGR